MLAWWSFWLWVYVFAKYGWNKFRFFFDTREDRNGPGDLIMWCVHCVLFPGWDLSEAWKCWCGDHSSAYTFVSAGCWIGTAIHVALTLGRDWVQDTSAHYLCCHLLSPLYILLHMRGSPMTRPQNRDVHGVATSSALWRYWHHAAPPPALKKAAIWLQNAI